METITYNGTIICVLDDSDMLTDCPLGSYAVIEDSGFYVAVLAAIYLVTRES
ncbi:hypothetical protein [Pectobacterium versatile]|uniref:hypothetical protein n=1 Tax=Pectobacterium versatile TaxID=2488639 RepID=UPI003017EF05